MSWNSEKSVILAMRWIRSNQLPIGWFGSWESIHLRCLDCSKVVSFLRFATSISAHCSTNDLTGRYRNSIINSTSSQLRFTFYKTCSRTRIRNIFPCFFPLRRKSQLVGYQKCSSLPASRQSPSLPASRATVTARVNLSSRLLFFSLASNMFRLLKSGLPKDPVFPSNLKGLGWGTGGIVGWLY